MADALPLFTPAGQRGTKRASPAYELDLIQPKHMEESMKDSNPKAVDFLGFQIECFQADDGSTYVPLKRLCEILGINYKWQMKKVKREEIFDEKVLPYVGDDGKRRKIFCLPVQSMYYWMFQIDPKTVRPEVLESLNDYRKESVQALRHRRLYGLAINPRRPAEDIESEVRDFLFRNMQERFRDRSDKGQRRFELLLAEIAMFGQFDLEPSPYRDKAIECIRVAIAEYDQWLAENRNTASYQPIQ